MTTLWSTPSARRLAVGITLAALAACANVPAPLQDVAEAERAVQAAADANAATLAPAAYDQARGKLEAAKTALQAQEHLKARQLAEQALGDAELAEITAHQQEAERAAAEIRTQIRAPAGPALAGRAGS
jgi:hypothetical protein